MNKYDANKIAKICFDVFNKLPKKGKPIDGHEWTVLSCILKYDSKTNDLHVISLGTGTKCLGKNSLECGGDILNDSHAEVMARRGFIRYIYEHIEQSISDKLNPSNIFRHNPKTDKFDLNETISFHFFTTHPPCGDGSIFVLESNNVEPCRKRLKLSEDDNDDDENIGQTLSNHLTGARLLDTNYADSMVQDVGKIRTKPGRGIRTLSLSCSDKISRWNQLGIQGALLSSIIHSPIVLESLTICGNGNVDVLKRAIYERWSNNESKVKANEPSVQRTDERILFQYTKQPHLQSSPNSIVWCDVKERCLEVAVNGKRQGITKKKLHLPMARLMISKIEFYKKYMKIMELCWPSKCIPNLTYGEAKRNCLNYTNEWQHIKTSIFGEWTIKPNDLLNFKIK